MMTQVSQIGLLAHLMGVIALLNRPFSGHVLLSFLLRENLCKDTQ